jgi:hypothetical protein
VVLDGRNPSLNTAVDGNRTQIMTTRQGLTRSGECEKMRKLSTAGWNVDSCNPNNKKDKQGASFLSKRIRHSVRFAH